MGEFSKFDPDPEQERKLREILEGFGPNQVDHKIRMVIDMCWLMLPREKRNPDELEKEIRPIFDRALQDFRNDYMRYLSEGR